MDETDDMAGAIEVADPEMRQLLGLFDVPAFARRGVELDGALARLRARCRREREGMLEMVRLRLRQWAASATGPADFADAFAAPIDGLWPLAGLEGPAWAARPAPRRARRSIARDLVASVERFDRRWSRFVAGLDLSPLNRLVDQYNKNYLFEKECVLGSTRLAARYFEARSAVRVEDLLAEFPTLPLPAFAGS
ncbi:MAG TPA: hypothetical protein VG406_19380 [Isosphaeraceae bacterium]|jgi:hypothetical protein|nr:hypothetical protein [Isosphaeraceae bacterium]